MMLSAVIFSALLVQFSSSFLFPYPAHASCKIMWNFGVNCSSVSDGIINQINIWKGDNCTGEKCRYEFVSFHNDLLVAKHKTPVKKYVDDLKFQFSASGKQSCIVKGFSTSETWYAVLDYGTNYCNLHNLIDGAGLTKVPGYKETTENKICTQYTSRNCTKY